MLPVSFVKSAPATKNNAGHAAVYFVTDAVSFSGSLAALDKANGGLVSRAVAANHFKGKAGSTQLISGLAAGGCDRVLLVGLGSEKEITTRSFEEAGGHAVAALNAAKAKTADFIITASGKKLKEADAAAHAVLGAQLRCYRFDKYRTKMKADEKPTLASLRVISAADSAAAKAFDGLKGLAGAVHFTRDLVNEPANILYPATLAAEAKKLAKLGVKVEVLGEAEMKKLGMGALLGVGQGSVRESQLVVMQWNGGKKSDKPLALVGKGVCFDTGGISIKPAGGMEEMKWDMAGSAAVIGTMHALAARKAKVNVVGVVGLVENMPDGNAQRPGDVVTSMSGQTIEVLNTDAEGRLVLADAVWYTQGRFKPKAIVDLATLTGAIIISLGSHRAGLFASDDTLAKHLEKSGEAVGERLWRMPLGDEYDAMINCDIADMKNISDGREAGSTTAAQFIQRFTNNIPWAHLDIAGVAWTKKNSAITPKGAVGWGVRLLNHWIAEYHEK
ncbi:MAG: leucyl aminopeptidase [Alphaproteobacteria bacterium]|nr:leucyl aminopeptidase [Alphaproteobacteria bacterium]